MRRRFLEQATLFFSIVKWTLLATLTGALVGVAVAGFLKSVDSHGQARGTLKEFKLRLT